MPRRNKPFFLYLPTNCPHGPFGDVPPAELAYYKDQNLSADQYPKTPGNPIPRNYDTDTQARVNAMIENIDQNVGRLLKWLDEKNLADNTLVIFMTDNGRATPGYNAGLRGNKTTVFEGGIKSPFFAYWPGKLQPGVASERIAMHIDLAPTILEICGVTKPADLKQDGRSIWPLLTRQEANWPDERCSPKAIAATSPCCITTSPPATKSGSSSAPPALAPKHCPPAAPSSSCSI